MSKRFQVGKFATRLNCSIVTSAPTGSGEGGIIYTQSTRVSGLACDIQPLVGETLSVYGLVEVQEATHYASTDTVFQVFVGDLFVDDLGQVYSVQYYENQPSILGQYTALWLKINHEVAATGASGISGGLSGISGVSGGGGLDSLIDPLVKGGILLGVF